MNSTTKTGITHSLSQDEVWWRATLIDSAHPDCQINFEFKAPTYSELVNYSELAHQALVDHVKSGTLKLRNIEPIEL